MKMEILERAAMANMQSALLRVLFQGAQYVVLNIGDIFVTVGGF